MSSHVVVISTDLRRTTVKVSPGTYLAEVLEKSCAHFKLSSSKYSLKHKQKTVDLSIPFRTSGLVPGAKLELVQQSNTPSAIQVALEVPLPEGKEIPGRRLIQKFPSNLSLWQVLRQFESGNASQGRNLNITSRAVAQTSGGMGSGSGQMYYEAPVLNIMGRELSSFGDLQKTLSQLGYNSGSVLIRMSYKLTGQTLFEAMEEIGQHFKESDDEGSGSVSAAKAPAVTEAEAETKPESAKVPASTDASAEADVDTPMDLSGEAASEPQPSADSGAPTSTSSLANPEDPYQPVNVFLAPSNPTPAAALAPESDSDYTPTFAHAQLHQARLLQSSRNKRLPSDKELAEKAAAEEAKQAAIKSLRVRIRFPDNTSSDWEVDANESGAFLYEAVRRVMARPEQPFHLTLPGNKTLIKDESGPAHSLVRGYKLSGRVLLYVVWEDAVPADVRKTPFLISEVAKQGQAVKVPDLPQQAGSSAGSSQEPQEEKKPEKSGDGVAKKIPKWLKLGKK